MAASEGAKEAVYFDRLLEELNHSDGKPIQMGCDNTGARDLAYNPEHHAKTKHIARRHFFVREMVENMKIRVPYVNTADNLADFFTKPLPARVFVPMRDAIMNCPMSVAAFQDEASSERGGVLFSDAPGTDGQSSVHGRTA